MLSEPCCGALGKLLQLRDSVVVAAKVARERGLGVRSDWPSSVDTVIPADLFLVALEHPLRVEDLVGILEEADLPFVILWGVRSHRRGGIDLDQPRSQLVIEQDVESIQLEAVLVIDDCLLH